MLLGQDNRMYYKALKSANGFFVGCHRWQASFGFHEEVQWMQDENISVTGYF